MAQIPGVAQASVHRVDLASFMESSEDAIVEVTMAGVISDSNQAADLLYRYAERELIGQAAEVLVPPALRVEQAAILRRVVVGEEIHSYRTQRLCRDGTTVPVLLTPSPIRDSANVIVGAAAIAHRVTGDLLEAYPDETVPPDQDAQDRRFQQHVDVEYARERRMVYEAQDRFEVVMGRERANERVQVQEAQDRFQARMDIERARETVDVRKAQDRFQAKMGVERAQERTRVEQAQDRFQIVMESERAQERVHVGHAQDRFQVVMDAGRAQARSDREYLQEQLHQGQRLEVLGQLAGGVAHDFNNLLGVILNYAAFVAEELADRPDSGLEAAFSDVTQIQRAAERATGLTHQLLAFARREIVRPRVLDLNQVVADVEQLLRRTIGDEILLTTDLAADLWPVLADSGQIEQVLVNLAVNARDAMTDGGTLRIDTANIALDAPADAPPTAGHHVRLRVSDTGTGMPTEIRDHVFEPFFTTKPQGAGTGLGLSTVHGIVAQAGGAVTVHSMPGTGTTLTILLPVTDEIAVPADVPAPFERVPVGETVLIVEDQEALRNVTERIFARAGYHVLTAANGAEAVTLAAQYDGRIHLLLTDVVMPTMLGKEAAERIRRLRPDIEVLFMSGYAQPVLAAQGRLDRDVNLIEKPFSASAIVEKAGRILNGHVDGLHAVTPSGTTDHGSSAPPDPSVVKRNPPHGRV